MNKRSKLQEIFLSGFKSFSTEGQNIPIGDITVLLGPNGAGKSNFVSFFTMLNYMTTGALQTYIGENGFADSFLYYGSKNTTRINANLVFSSKEDKDDYKFSLAHATGDNLIFTEETITYSKEDNLKPFVIELDPGSKESGLFENTKNANTKEAEVSKVLYNLLRRCQVFQFHDTSRNANIRKPSYIHDNRYLRSDAGNLAAFLYVLKNKSDGEKYYNRIIRNIQQIMPQFNDFDLHPSALNENYIILNWKEKKSDFLFGPHQISDGTLRFMAMATLLLQPSETLPNVVILDEPELGLHPTAISALSEMVNRASQQCQVILATQSTRLVDEFLPENVLVVERDPTTHKSVFKKLNKEKLNEWLTEYSMSELWEKNVVGGKP